MRLLITSSALTSQAAAQLVPVCSVSVANSNLSFGSVDVTQNAVVDSQTTVSVTCSALVSVALRVCVNIGPGGGGASSASTRFMKSGANSLTYGLFSDAGRTNAVGSTSWGGGGSPIIIDFPLLAVGGITKTATLYGRVYASQQTAPSGSYSSLFTGADARIQYGLLSLLDCNLLTDTASTTFTVTASVPAVCNVTANNLNFGTIESLSSVVDGSTTVSPVCTNGTAYNVGLNGGLSGATDPTQRKLQKGSEFILYGLYRDFARTLPFGDTIGSNTLTGTGSGVPQSLPIFGRIPVQTMPSSGLYSDTIIVTLTF